MQSRLCQIAAKHTCTAEEDKHIQCVAICGQGPGYGKSRDLQPLPPASHLAHTNQETSEQIPQSIEEAGQDIGQTEISSDVYTHDTVEGHQVERAVDDEEVPA